MKNEMPKWFKGKVYARGGFIVINNSKYGDAPDIKIKLDRKALSIYHLIQGYKALGRLNDKHFVKGVQWFRENYPEEAKIIFPITADRIGLKNRIKNSQYKLKENIYRLFNKDN
tara:strand:- start:200 stop:541 length:342 start_codon:yes stop_codon:yes gene_type:complete